VLRTTGIGPRRILVAPTYEHTPNPATDSQGDLGPESEKVPEGLGEENEFLG